MLQVSNYQGEVANPTNCTRPSDPCTKLGNDLSILVNNPPGVDLMGREAQLLATNTSITVLKAFKSGSAISNSITELQRSVPHQQLHASSSQALLATVLRAHAECMMIGCR